MGCRQIQIGDSLRQFPAKLVKVFVISAIADYGIAEQFRQAIAVASIYAH